MLQEPPYISEMAKEHGELAKSRPKDGKDTVEFWFWLGYYDGQNSVTEHFSEEVKP